MKNDKYSVGDRTGKHNTFSSRILSYGKVATLTPSHLFRFRVKLPNSMLEGLKQYYLLHMPDCQLNVMGSNPRQDRTTLINFCSMSAAESSAGDSDGVGRLYAKDSHTSFHTDQPHGVAAHSHMTRPRAMSLEVAHSSPSGWI